MPDTNKDKERHSPLVLVDTENLTREEWLEWRRHGIGGSDVSAIIGVSPFRTARDTYYDKLGKYPHVEDIYRDVKDIYEYTGKDYAVIVPSRIEEIMDEGAKLHHCVGSSDRYWERIERRESYVLFLRKASKPEDSYYTLEIEPDGTVRQKRTMYDRQSEDIKDAEKFLREWQEVISKRITAKERGLAEKSRILRNQEFIQMRENQVIIHAGDLRGQLLADVLMKDLMENKEALAGTALADAA